jgi:hypothetical protein
VCFQFSPFVFIDFHFFSFSSDSTSSRFFVALAFVERGKSTVFPLKLTKFVTDKDGVAPKHIFRVIGTMLYPPHEIKDEVFAMWKRVCSWWKIDSPE